MFVCMRAPNNKGRNKQLQNLFCPQVAGHQPGERIKGKLLVKKINASAKHGSNVVLVTWCLLASLGTQTQKHMRTHTYRLPIIVTVC